jgi:hypothetical protein
VPTPESNPGWTNQRGQLPNPWSDLACGDGTVMCVSCQQGDAGECIRELGHCLLDGQGLRSTPSPFLGPVGRAVDQANSYMAAEIRAGCC